ncbi:MAG: response regulator [Lachnospiraceae bacterium]|nr:response regulator [Lachnospiraceae bacterium]
MINNLYRAFFGDDIPLEEKNVNLAMVFYYSIMLAALIYGMVNSLPTVFFVVTLGVFFFTLVVYAYTVRTGTYDKGAFIVALTINLVELPLSYYADGRQICPAVILFVMSFFFCIFCLKGKMLAAALLLSLGAYVASVYGMYMRSYRYEPFDLSGIIIITDVLIPLLICGIYACKAMDYRDRIYEREEEKVAKGRAQAEEMSKTKDLFLMNMSHEMRTPMNTIITATGLIGDKTKNSALKQNVVYLQNACNALISNIDDLLVFSKAENSGMSLAETDFDTRILFEDIINIISVRLIDRQIRFEIQLDPSIPVVLKGDVAKIRQLYINILNNAVKYTNEGSIRLKVGYERTSDETILIKTSIEDTGIGIRQEDIPKLFNAFERLDDREHDSLKIEGTGLGLSICSSIIKTMNGKIDVESSYNEGSRFTFEIPVRVVDEKEMLKVENVKHISVLLYEEDRERSQVTKRVLDDLGISCTEVYDDEALKERIENERFTHVLVSLDRYEKNCRLLEKTDAKQVVISTIEGADRIPRDADRLLRPVSVLAATRYFNHEGYTKFRDLDRGFTCPKANVMIIDDNRTNLFVIDRLLKRYGMNTVTAERGQEALNLIGDNRFDMIFIDYMMPEMDGIDILEKIRKNPKSWCAKVPCIVLTADAADGARQMLIDAGFDDYISKPIQIERLAEAIYDQIDPSLIEWVED